MLALEKNPGPAQKECRFTQKLFLDYLKGRTTAKKTAQLSRHLEECFECELAFERFQEAGHGILADPKGRGWRAFWRRFLRPGKHLAVAALVIAALAAGAFGIVGLLTSAAIGTPGNGLAATGGRAQPDGLVLRPARIRAVLDGLLALDPTLDSGPVKLSDLVASVLDEASTPNERMDVYKQLGKSPFKGRIEPLLWILAENEPIPDPRSVAYEALRPKDARDTDALLKAARREIAARSPSTAILLPALSTHLTDEVRAYLVSLFANDDAREEVYWAERLSSVYVPLRGEPVIEKRLKRNLDHPDDDVRAWAVATSELAENRDALPIAIRLLDSPKERAKSAGARFVARYGSDEDLKAAAKRDWSKYPNIGVILTAEMSRRGIPLQNL
jgi:hypothetical protein